MKKTEELGPVYGVPLIDSMPINALGWTQAMPSRDNLERVRKVAGGERTVAGYEALLAHLWSIMEDVPTLHLRTCWGCRSLAWHADAITPYCRKCGSQDTRKVKP